ncbi:YbhB/YbcL family Raf kinase inhibitor-like protein [Sphingobium sufflavum]|uniref:YbhB/YbcL family Raf kinase inhibitor-like protein n=1 Tax=Sphingobium sufflavum TaxID=1129547 RepID=UPI001F48898E|nr:YbhB/YbcL family Raf kinase inhibitor-like protein [Sphingobium sufflavum]MCE7796176.1 YbhB/YbcL family Raf kinase inhibitor-like protein [Sphingobium sufflavum]
MLEHVPNWLGHMLHNVRAGHSKLVIVQEEVVRTDAYLALSSPAFANGARLPERFTADGEGVSPPLLWGEPPAGTASLALIVEDPDAPAASPLVHAIVWNLPADERRLAEGAIAVDDGGARDGRDVGRNSYFFEGWLPPDPPTGHGRHDYVFQLFALSETARLGSNPGRSELVGALAGRVLAAGMLVGTYSRGEDAPIAAEQRAGDYGAGTMA